MSEQLCEGCGEESENGEETCNECQQLCQCCGNAESISSEVPYCRDCISDAGDGE